MPSNSPNQRFEDIAENIRRIEVFTTGLDADDFLADLKTYDAVERCLERISEAAKKLDATADELCPEIPWPSIRGLGNLLRHEYDRIDGTRIWFLIERDLPGLRVAVERALKSLA